VVRLRGLPFSATTSDVLDFLGNPEVADMDDPLVFTYTYDGRPTGEAYIALGSQAAQQAALAKHKQMLGPRYIEVFTATMSDVGQAKQDMRVNSQQSALRMQWAAAAASGRVLMMPPGGMVGAQVPHQMPMGPGMYGMPPAAAAAAAAGTGVGMPGGMVPAMNPLGMGPPMAAAAAAPVQGEQQAACGSGLQVWTQPVTAHTACRPSTAITMCVTSVCTTSGSLCTCCGVAYTHWAGGHAAVRLLLQKWSFQRPEGAQDLHVCACQECWPA
jgi:hypothetical protein